MTYGELFEIAVKDLELNKTDIEDYRPYGVNAIKLWLKSGVEVVYDYDIFHKQSSAKTMSKELALGYCRDFIQIDIPKDENCITTITLKGDSRLIFGDNPKVVVAIDRTLAEALKIVLDKISN